MATTPGTRKLQPIIIKRVKKTTHAHHGGAWKIAYADFVTAMMAFFLLMWLLGSTAKGDLQGIASYFNSPMKVEMAGGSGAGSASSVVPGGGRDLTRTTGEVRRTDGSTMDPKKIGQDNSLKLEQARQDARRMAALRARIEEMINANPKLREFRSQIKLEVTSDGLEIQIVDAQNRPMFDTGSAIVKPYMHDILRAVGSALNDIENRVSLAGHTDAAPYGNGDRGYGNWELSADRANASRRELVAAGMPDDKLVRVVGLAASDLLDKKNALAPLNRRISIVVLTRDAESRLFGNARLEGNDAVKAIATELAKEQKKPEGTDAPAAPAGAAPAATPGRAQP
ncbi:flagellar motor protein MotB [Variovorax sp. DAIF25]|uniref:flagellar motor protein MotB n=1 Tax=Variovorax sp. DAIF25 TaxID=3080983 RepID=UPI003D6B51B4